MLELKLLLFAQGLRFLLFDYKLFAPLRAVIDGVPVLHTLLRCPFCQGFWCGFFSFLFFGGLIDAFLWGLGSGFISITWYALIIPQLDKIEGGDQPFDQ